MNNEQTKDTPMFRATAMIVHLDTNEMQARARELAQRFPHQCCVSNISPWKKETPERPYFYYLGNFNEEWIRTGVGVQVL